MLPRGYLGMIHAFKEMYAKEGVFHGLYRGFIANSISIGLKAMIPIFANKFNYNLEFTRFKNSGADLI
jgi:hypothetical protein